MTALPCVHCASAPRGPCSVCSLVSEDFRTWDALLGLLMWMVADGGMLRELGVSELLS